jgi:hypothetical protein
MNDRILSKLGWAGVAAAALGVPSAALMLAWPAQVERGVLSYPFTADGFTAIQTWFFAHHFLLVAVAIGFASSRGVGPSRIARAGAWIAVLGLVGLTGMELFAIQFAGWDAKAANEGVMGTGYGITTTLVGLGMLAGGVGVVRARLWHGPWRFAPLLIGISHFVLVMPAVFSNGFAIARLAIGTWIALFGALGWGLVLEARRR